MNSTYGEKMMFEFSPNIAVQTNDKEKAVHFYTKVLGLENRSQNPDKVDIAAGPLTMFV